VEKYSYKAIIFILGPENRLEISLLDNLSDRSNISLKIELINFENLESFLDLSTAFVNK